MSSEPFCEGLPTSAPTTTAYPTSAPVEEDPYGIEMVLENVTWWEEKFAEGPRPGSAKVCVVDTGYGNGSEDLSTHPRQ